MSKTGSYQLIGGYVMHYNYILLFFEYKIIQEGYSPIMKKTLNLCECWYKRVLVLWFENRHIPQVGLEALPSPPSFFLVASIARRDSKVRDCIQNRMTPPTFK